MSAPAVLLPVWHDGVLAPGASLQAGVTADEWALADFFRMDAAAAFQRSAPPGTPPVPGAFVRAVMVNSLDGQTIGPDGSSRSISTPEDYWAFVTLRSVADVIVVGSRTAVQEQLSLPRGRASLVSWRREQGLSEFPALAVVTTSGELPHTNLFSRPGACVVLTTVAERERVVARLRAEHGVAEPLVVACEPELDHDSGPQSAARVSARGAVAALVELGFQHLVCEGGPTLLGSFLNAGVVAEVALSTVHEFVGTGASGGVTPVAQGLMQRVPLRQRSLLLGASTQVGLFTVGAG